MHTEQATPQAVTHALLLFGAMLLVTAVPSLQRWPLGLFFPILLSTSTLYAIPRLRYRPDWFRLGESSRSVTTLGLLTLFLAPICLFIWYKATSPNLSAFSQQIPHRSLWLTLLAGITFALINSVSEEVVFRGVLQQALTIRLGVRGAWWLQGLMFGLMHSNGVPQGVTGMVLATAFGVVLGWIRYKSKGVGLCCLLHFVTDAVIFGLILA